MMKKILLPIALLLFLSFSSAVEAQTNWCDDANIEVGYLFDEASGDAADCTSNNFTGTVVNDITYEEVGVFGTAFGFPGTNDYVSIGTQLPYLTTETVVAWVNPDTISITSAFFDQGNAVLENTLFVGGSGALKFQRSTALGSGFVASRTSNNSVFSAGSYQHVAVSFDGDVTDMTGVLIYVDGVEVGYAALTNRASTPNDESASNFLVGMGSNGSSFDYDGDIDEFALFNDVKDATDINDIMDNGLVQAVTEDTDGDFFQFM